MIELGNHPHIPEPVALNIKFEDFNNTVIINGKYCFRDIIKFLRKTQYISESCDKIMIHMIGTPHSYALSFADKIMDLKLTEFENAIETYNHEKFPNSGFVYHEELEIC